MHFIHGTSCPLSSLGMCFLASDTESRLCSSFAFLFWALQFALVCNLDKPLCLERGSPVLFKKLVSLYTEPRSKESQALPGQLLGVKSFRITLPVSPGMGQGSTCLVSCLE